MIKTLSIAVLIMVAGAFVSLGALGASLLAPVPALAECVDPEGLGICNGNPSPAPATGGSSRTNCTTPKCDALNKRIIEIINFLSAVVGVAVAGSIVVGGIQYTMAGENPSKVQEAKTRIRNAIIALLAYFFLYTFLQWLIPGGLFD